MDLLRNEILQAQSTRSDLLKWKLGLVGLIGAVGLGLAGSKSHSHADLVLSAVPLLCVYVDLLCRHMSLRIMVIGVFMRGQSGAGNTAGDRVMAAYESHAQRAREAGAFRLEDWAVAGSTFVLSAAVAVYGVLILFGVAGHDPAAGVVFILSGVVGLVTTAAAESVFTRRCQAVVAMAG